MKFFSKNISKKIDKSEGKSRVLGTPTRRRAESPSEASESERKESGRLGGVPRGTDKKIFKG